MGYGYNSPQLEEQWSWKYINDVQLEIKGHNGIFEVLFMKNMGMIDGCCSQ